MMADQPSNLSGQQADDPLREKGAPARVDRLESWKEIAAYLKRGLRTVQRWEKQEGLPVHRLQHDKASTVYAYKAELDAWWDEGRSRLEKESEEEAESEPIESGNGHAPIEAATPRPSLHRRNRLFWILGATAAVVVFAAVAIYFLRPRPSVALHFHARDMVLISSFDNRTGDPLFDGTIEAALGRELTNSQFVSVAPRVRIDDTLALMRKPANTHVDAALGREICLRDGGIRAMITGRIDKFGSTYLVSANLVDPASGRFVASFEEQANSQAAILPAVHRLSDRLRQALGEDLSQIRKSDLALQHVTTPSLKALQLYTKADQQMETLGRGGQKVAFELLKQAIDEDPNFASAYILAAYTLDNQGKLPSEYMPYAKRALELSAHVSEPERYFIEGSYYDMTGQVDRAEAAYEALLQIDPTHYWAMNNLITQYRYDPAKEQECNALAVRRAELRPNNFQANWVAGYREAVLGGSPALAHKYVERAKAIYSATDSTNPAYVGEAIWLQLYPAFQAWMQDDVTLAVEKVNQAEKNPMARDGVGDPEASGFFALALGQARKANTLFQNVSSPKRYLFLAILAYFRGDEGSSRYWLRQMPSRSTNSLSPIVLMLREGLLHEANAAIQKFPPKVVPRLIQPWPVELVKGELLLAQKQTAKAEPLLRKGIEGEGAMAWPTYFFDAESLAQAYERQGNLPAALQVLERASTKRSSVDYRVAMGGAPFWMQDQLDLARLYLRLGRFQDAQEIENELRKLLAYADPDFPLLVELKRLQSTPPVPRMRTQSVGSHPRLKLTGKGG
jgi:tetratricopeptide (TPR) repeat protein